MTDYLCNFAKTGNPNDSGNESQNTSFATNLPIWQSSLETKKNVLCMGESETSMKKPSKFKMIRTMLTSNAVGE